MSQHCTTREIIQNALVIVGMFATGVACGSPPGGEEAVGTESAGLSSYSGILHAGDLDWVTVRGTPTATAQVHDGSHLGVGGATVSGTFTRYEWGCGWSDIPGDPSYVAAKAVASQAASCATDSTGSCSVTSTLQCDRNGWVRFAVGSIAYPAQTTTTGTCAPYTAGYTYWTSQNYVTCGGITLNEGDRIAPSTCGTSTGTTYLMIVNPAGGIVARGYGCNAVPALAYTVPPGGAGAYSIREGCDSNYNCSGTVSYTVTDLGYVAAANHDPDGDSNGTNIGCPQAKVPSNLHCGGGCTYCVSDREQKTNIAPVHERDVLDAVSHLPVATWAYKNDPSVRHLGPMAQDFKAAFDLGDTDRAYYAVDAQGVALASIKALHALVKEQSERIDRLEAANRELRAESLASGQSSSPPACGPARR
jgi:hypothetical protein